MKLPFLEKITAITAKIRNTWNMQVSTSMAIFLTCFQAPLEETKHICMNDHKWIQTLKRIPPLMSTKKLISVGDQARNILEKHPGSSGFDLTIQLHVSTTEASLQSQRGKGQRSDWQIHVIGSGPLLGSQGQAKQNFIWWCTSHCKIHMKLAWKQTKVKVARVFTVNFIYAFFLAPSISLCKFCCCRSTGDKEVSKNWSYYVTQNPNVHHMHDSVQAVRKTCFLWQMKKYVIHSLSSSRDRPKGIALCGTHELCSRVTGPPRRTSKSSYATEQKGQNHHYSATPSCC